MTPAEAKRLFTRERSAFAKYFPWVKRTRIIILDQQCSSRRHCELRDLAFAEQSPPSVSILKRALSLPRHNIIGLFRHELGHIADEHINSHGREQRADDIAEFVSGQRIRYDQHDIQTVGRGKYPRPTYLHR